MNAIRSLERNPSHDNLIPNSSSNHVVANSVIDSTQPLSTPVSSYPSWPSPINHHPHSYHSNSSPSSRRAPPGGFQRRELNGDWRRGRGLPHRGGGFRPLRTSSSTSYHPRAHPPPPPSWTHPPIDLPQPNGINSASTVGTPTTDETFETPPRYDPLKQGDESDDRVHSSGEFVVDDLSSTNHRFSSPDGNGAERGSFQNRPTHRVFREWNSNESMGSLQHRLSGSRECPPALQVTIQKTRLCVHLTRGRQCPKHNCMFAHSTTELRQRPDLFRTKLCRSFNETGGCENGNDCRFAHGLQELRHTKEFYKTALCSLWKNNGVCKVGASCRFAHGPHELRPPPTAYGIRSWNSAMMMGPTCDDDNDDDDDGDGDDGSWGGKRSSGDLEAEDLEKEKHGDTAKERIIMRVIASPDGGVQQGNIDNSDGDNLHGRYVDDLQKVMLMQQTTTTDSTTAEGSSPKDGQNSSSRPIEGIPLPSSSSSLISQDTMSIRRCPPPPPSSPNIPPDFGTGSPMIQPSPHPHLGLPISSNCTPQHNSLPPYNLNQQLDTWYLSGPSQQQPSRPPHQFGPHDDPLHPYHGGGSPLHCNSLPIMEHHHSIDGVVMPEQRRFNTMGLPPSSTSPYRSSNQLQSRQHLNFWPGSTERAPSCASPTPSTHSSPAVVFRPNAPSSGRIDQPPHSTTARGIQVTSTKGAADESQRPSDWLSQISHFKPALPVTHESIYSVQYED